MLVTDEWLELLLGSHMNIMWAIKNNIIGMEGTDALYRLIENEEYDWSVWLAVQLLDKRHALIFGSFCAKKAAIIYEGVYPAVNLRHLLLLNDKIIQDPSDGNVWAAYQMGLRARESKMDIVIDSCLLSAIQASEIYFCNNKDKAYSAYISACTGYHGNAFVNRRHHETADAMTKEFKLMCARMAKTIVSSTSSESGSSVRSATRSPEMHEKEEVENE